MKYLSLLISLFLIVSGCARPLFAPSMYFDDGELDYAKLFRIAYALTSPEREQNIEDLTTLFGSDKTTTLLRWYDATLLGIKAAKVIIGATRTLPLNRDVADVIEAYTGEP